MECPKCAYEAPLRAMCCPQCATVFDLPALEEYAHLGYLRTKLRRWEESGKLTSGLARAVSRLVAEERERLTAWVRGSPSRAEALQLLQAMIRAIFAAGETSRT